MDDLDQAYVNLMSAAADAAQGVVSYVVEDAARDLAQAAVNKAYETLSDKENFPIEDDTAIDRILREVDKAIGRLGGNNGNA